MTRPADGIAEEPQVSGLSSRPRGVLVIDDTEAVRGFLGAALEGAGFAVWLASSGREGAACVMYDTISDFTACSCRVSSASKVVNAPKCVPTFDAVSESPL